MHVRVLGASAGGGFPQWNCGCPNCVGVRRGSLNARPRTQSQVAVSADGHAWHLLNASPDLRQQIMSHADLQPSGAHPRESPIRSVTLTNADLDHTLGTLLLRESQPLRIYATPAVRALLREHNAYFKMLEQFDGQTEWIDFGTHEPFTLTGPSDEDDGRLRVIAYSLEGSPPYWAKRLSDLAVAPPVVGLSIEDRQTGQRLGYFPGVGRIDDGLLDVLARCDAILFDGTFWDDHELQRLNAGARTARQMQHVPLSGADGSIARLRELPTRVRKIFTHVNNTNPILNEDSAEHRFVRDAGWEVSHDGQEVMR